MTDKKASGTATSATKKAAAATKKPVIATPAAPKVEVIFLFLIIHKFIIKINRK